MTVESAGDPRARSPKGAMGLMQIMPETWADLRAHRRFGNDPYDPHDSILAGAVYLRNCTTAMARPVSSPRTMRARAATNTISRAVHCRRRPAPMWQRLLFCWVAVNSPVRSPSLLFIRSHGPRRRCSSGDPNAQPLPIRCRLSVDRTALRRVIRCAISQQSCRKRAACLLLDPMPVASHDGMCSLARHSVLRDRTAGGREQQGNTTTALQIGLRETGARE